MNLKKYLFPEPKGLLPSIIGGGSGYLRRGGGSGGGGSSYQLAAGEFIPAKMSMVLVSPRPNAEITSTIARQQYAFADGVFQYRVRIAIQGGAFPFYEDTAYRSGFPTGMSIESNWNAAGYMYITWTPAAGEAGNTYSPSTRIYDQDGNFVTVSWTVTAVGDDGSKFIFLDPNAGTNGSGTKASPLNTFSGIGAAAGNTSTYAGKIIVLRSGTTTFVGPDADPYGNDQFIFNANKNPHIFLGYTGETCVLNMTGGWFQNQGQHDPYWGQITISNLCQGCYVGGERSTVFYDSGYQIHRLTGVEITIQNSTWYTGSGASSNQTGWYFQNSYSFKQYNLIADIINTGSNIPTVDMFGWKWGVIENVAYSSMSGSFPHGSGCQIKDSCQYVSMRRIKADRSASMNFGLMSYSGQTASGYANDYLEYCYCSDDCPVSSRSIFTYLIAGSVSQTPHVWLYRSTLRGAVLHHNNAGTYVQEYNILVNDNGFYGVQCGDEYTQTTCTTLSVTSTNNVTGTIASGYVDGNNELTGPGLSYLYTHGFQLRTPV